VRGLLGALLLLCVLGWTGQAGAALIDAEFRWTGSAGYSAVGLFTYDDGFPVASGAGAGPTLGLQELSISFFDPSDALLAVHDDVTAGVSSYAFLQFSYDTGIEDLVFGSAFDVGADSGGPGEYYLMGTVGGGFTLFGTGPTRLIDSAPSAPSFGAIPEPASGALLALGRSGLAASRRRASPSGSR
jgi:hypothetical protein